MGLKLSRQPSSSARAAPGEATVAYAARRWGGGQRGVDENEENLTRLPPELWQKILDENVQQDDLFALASTCRFFRDTPDYLGKKMETNLSSIYLLELLKSGKMASHSLGWFQWVCDTFEILPGFTWPHHRAKGGAVYEGDLVNYAVFQGSVEILRWLVEEKGFELNDRTGWWAGMGGSIEVFEHLSLRGYKSTKAACEGTAIGGHLEALKYLRGLDPPCPWDNNTCAWAAEGGHLEVLKWLRSQDPPCPWDVYTCFVAAGGGHLDVLKWLRSLSPPCPWSRRKCRENASQDDHQHIIDWIDQREDESDAEFIYSDVELSDSDRSYDSYDSYSDESF